MKSTKKACSKCKLTKPLSTGFHRDSSKKSGYSSQCKVCKEAGKKLARKTPEGARKEAAKQRRYVANRNVKKREYIRTLKETTPCADCGKLYPYYIMEFDHVTDVKNFNISAGAVSRYVSMAMLKAEVALCEIVCAICHRERTHDRGYRRG